MFDDDARKYEVVRDPGDPYAMRPRQLPVPDGRSAIGSTGRGSARPARFTGVGADPRPAGTRTGPQRRQA